MVYRNYIHYMVSVLSLCCVFVSECLYDRVLFVANREGMVFIAWVPGLEVAQYQLINEVMIMKYSLVMFGIYLIC